ncbi:MAG: hypothetical protein COB84_02725 [Rhodobacteraceae bacterium]|nr:MAG: hypothetical protein COB84_02725 [Paracoccaceae bacterium]
MILRMNGSVLRVLLTASFLLPAGFALSSGAPPKEEETAEGDEMVTIFKVTSPTARNPLPTEIMGRMRKELMVLMGVEPEKIEEPAEVKKTGH